MVAADSIVNASAPRRHHPQLSNFLVQRLRLLEGADGLTNLFGIARERAARRFGMIDRQFLLRMFLMI